MPTLPRLLRGVVVVVLIHRVGAGTRTGDDACSAQDVPVPPWWAHYGYPIVALAILLHCLLLTVIVQGFKSYFARRSVQHRPFHWYDQLKDDVSPEDEDVDSPRERAMTGTASWDVLKMGPRKSLPKSTPEAIRKEKDFLLWFCYRLLYLGLANFATGPAFFALTYYQSKKYILVALIAIATKAITGTILQNQLVSKLHGFMEDSNPAIAKHYHSPIHTLLPIPRSVFLALIACSDFADLDLDCANAGQTWALPSETLSEYCVTWHRVPLIGQPAILLGLPGTLSLLVVFATILQLSVFLRKMYMVITTNVDKWAGQGDKALNSRLDVWFELQHACDAGSLTLMAETLNALCKYAKQDQVQILNEEAEKRGEDNSASKTLEYNQVPYCHIGRSTAFLTRNLGEAVPSLWFSVSLLAISFDSVSAMALKLMILSVLSSIMTIIKAGANEFQGCVESIRVGNIWLGFGSSIQLGAVYRLNLLMLSNYLCLMSIARLSGIWFCSSHILNLSQGCVEVGGLTHNH